MKQQPKKQMTPVTLFREIKRQYKDTVILIRAGNDYTCLGEDAALMEQVIGIKTTLSMHFGKQCSFSRYRLDLILSLLVKAGYRVAVSNPLENPAGKEA